MSPAWQCGSPTFSAAGQLLPAHTTVLQPRACPALPVLGTSNLLRTLFLVLMTSSLLPSVLPMSPPPHPLSPAAISSSIPHARAPVVVLEEPGELHRWAIYGVIDLEGSYWQLLRKSDLLPFGMSLLGRLEPICSVGFADPPSGSCWRVRMGDAAGSTGNYALQDLPCRIPCLPPQLLNQGLTGTLGRPQPRYPNNLPSTSDNAGQTRTVMVSPMAWTIRCLPFPLLCKELAITYL